MTLYLLRRANGADRWQNYEPMRLKETSKGQAILLGFNAFFRRRDALEMKREWQTVYDIDLKIVAFKSV
jgi:hypothetical protein